MTNRLWIAVLLAAVTLGTAAHAHGGGDRGWRDHRHDRWQHERHDHWRHQHRHDHWRHGYAPPYAYGWQDRRPAPRHFDNGPAMHLPLPPLPPSPHEVHRAIRDRLFGR
jgi:hypothetical protein